MKRLLRTTFLSMVCLPLWAQPTAIELKNPSFEDQPAISQVPSGWTPCGFPEETPPDTHPGNAFGVKMPTNDGKTYLGMVVRDNDTWEGVTQPLDLSDDNEVALDEKIESVRELLTFMDVPPARIKVIPFSKADSKEYWVGKRDGVLLSVEQK